MRMEVSQLITPQTRRWAMRSIARIGQRIDRVQARPGRKLLVVHLDGVPRQVLDRAIHERRMPFLSAMIRSGAFHYDHAFWGTPASTPAFQAGLLYGLRHPNLPAYSWYERDMQKVIRMNVPKEAHAIEQRVHAMASDSLVQDGGTTYLSLFKADAENELALASLANLKAMAPALVSQLRGLRTVRRQTVLQYLGELGRDTLATSSDALKWIKAVGSRRHELNFALNRFFITRLAWGLSWNRTLIDMVRGVPAIYLVFGNFDEVAHRRGPFSEQAAHELYHADAALEELYVMSQLVEDKYDIVLVTDHGHVDSAPFEKRQGKKLQDFLLGEPAVPLSDAVARALQDGRPLPDEGRAPSGDPVVIEAGNFSHVYLTGSYEPLEALELLRFHRGVLANAAASKDIGIVAVRRGDEAVAIIRGGVYRADEIAQSPLSTEFSKRAVADLLRELPHMPTAGDLVLFGEATHEGGTVGFAWEFGSHGGLTITETDSAVIWPADAPMDLRGLSHSVQLHDKLSEVYRH